jgi:hypothetical protein
LDVRVIITALLAFIAGMAGTIWFYSNGGRIIAWGNELGPRTVTVAAPAPTAAPPRPANAPRPANPVRTVEEEGKPTSPPPQADATPPSGAAAPKQAPVPADALNILGVVIVWPGF